MIEYTVRTSLPCLLMTVASLSQACQVPCTFAAFSSMGAACNCWGRSLTTLNISITVTTAHFRPLPHFPDDAVGDTTNCTRRRCSFTLSPRDLSNNRLTSVPVDTFSHLSSLLTLILASNRISELEQDSFRGLAKLTTLNLQQNVIGSIPAHAFFPTLPSIRHLFLQGNPLEFGRSLCSVFQTQIPNLIANTDFLQMIRNVSRSTLTTCMGRHTVCVDSPPPLSQTLVCSCGPGESFNGTACTSRTVACGISSIPPCAKTSLMCNLTRRVYTCACPAGTTLVASECVPAIRAMTSAIIGGTARATMTTIRPIMLPQTMQPGGDRPDTISARRCIYIGVGAGIFVALLFFSSIVVFRHRDAQRRSMAVASSTRQKTEPQDCSSTGSPSSLVSRRLVLQPSSSSSPRSAHSYLGSLDDECTPYCSTLVGSRPIPNQHGTFGILSERAAHSSCTDATVSPASDYMDATEAVLGENDYLTCIDVAPETQHQYLNSADALQDINGESIASVDAAFDLAGDDCLSGAEVEIPPSFNSIVMMPEQTGAMNSAGFVLPTNDNCIMTLPQTQATCPSIDDVTDTNHSGREYSNVCGATMVAQSSLHTLNSCHGDEKDFPPLNRPCEGSQGSPCWTPATSATTVVSIALTSDAAVYENCAV